jgi:hypothetical protein
MLARCVKTVNTQPGGKTVGVGRHRYRLRWILGIEVNHQKRDLTRVGVSSAPRPALARTGAGNNLLAFCVARDRGSPYAHVFGLPWSHRRTGFTLSSIVRGQGLSAHVRAQALDIVLSAHVRD